MRINSSLLLDAYEQSYAFVHEQQEMMGRFDPVEQAFEDKKSKADAVVMIYGVYNAGKSTLINALLGQEVAATDDIPLTDRVTAYAWGPYSILDTPGVDAPINHENVTREQLLKADAVIFVVDPVGTAEESRTLEVMMDLVQEGKQVFVVFNEKKPLPDEDYITLKDQTRARLQHMAGTRGLVNVLKDIPMVKVNAKRAFQGHLKEQPKLLELSGFPAFEKLLRGFLLNISADDIYGRLKLALAEFLQEYVQLLQNGSQSAAGKKYDRLLRDIGLEKSRLTQNMQREVTRQRQSIHDKCRMYIRSSPQDCQPRIEQLLQLAGEDICALLSHEMQAFIAKMEDEVEQVQAAIPRIEHQTTSIPMPTLEQGGADGAAGEGVPSQRGTAGVDASALKDAAQQIGALAKPDHIVSGLKVVKDVMPSLMKGIGIKTMEKWATLLTTKWIPYVGLVVTAGQLLYGLFAGDPEEAALRKQNEEQERVKERAVQQIDDIAGEISDGFESSIRELIKKETEVFFANVAEQVEILRKGFNEAEQASSKRLERLLAIQQSVAEA